MQRPVRVFAGIPLVVAILSCGGGGDGPTEPPPPVIDPNAVATVTVTAPATTLAVGKTMVLSAQATNAAGTILTGQTFVWSTSIGAIATVEQNGTVAAVAQGSVVITAAAGGRNSSVTLTTTPRPPAVSIAVSAGNGQTALINTSVATPPSVIVKDAAGDPVSGITVTFAVTQGGGSITGSLQTTNSSGIATVGSWKMGSTPVQQTLIATPTDPLAGSPVTFTATASPLPSNMRQYNTSTSFGCTNIQLRTGEVKAETAHLTIVDDITNPAGGFTQADYDALAATFESLVWPVLTENFGAPTDIDGGGRVVAFFTSAVNALTPAGSTSFVGGFFFARDLLPKIKDGVITDFDCPGSNVAEMFYLLAPDPAGSLGLAHSTSFVRTIAMGIIGHEMQHLINASRRIYISTTATELEDVWMEEGLSHIAEELLFYEASGRSPRSNLTSSELSGASASAATSYARANLQRLSLYLRDPRNNSPYADNDRLATRGATWSMLRYLADRGSASTITGEACPSQTIVLAAGASCRLEGGAGPYTIDGSGGSEYTIVAFASGGGVIAEVSSTNALAPVGPPSPTLAPMKAMLSQLPGGRTLDMSFHTRLRNRTEHEVVTRIPHARATFRQRNPASARFSVNGAAQRPSFAHGPVESVWGRLVNRGPVGMANLEAEFGSLVTGAIRDWAVANYVDDVVPVPPAYTHPSWNFRSAMSMPGVSPYAIEAAPLAPTQSLTLEDGGAAYFRLGVAASTTSVVTFTVNAAMPQSNLKLVLVRTK